MKKVKITNKSLMVNFEFPIEVGQVISTAVAQVFIYENDKKELEGDFDFVDQVNKTYMGMPIENYKAWDKLCDHHTEFGVNLRKLCNDEFDKVVDDNFKKYFISQFNINDFQI